MTFTIINSELNARLGMVAKVVNSKNTLSILDNIIFRVEDGMLHLKASDSENTLSTQVEVSSSEGEGAFAVNAKNITDAVRSLPAATEITFNHNEDTQSIKVSYMSGMFTLPVMNADEFPVSPELDANKTVKFSMKDASLVNNIGRTLFATANDELRPVMNGIFFDVKEDGLTVVASDGHQLIRCNIQNVKPETSEDGTNATGTFIMPKKPATLLKGVLGKTGEDVTVAFDERNMVVRTEIFTLVSRLIEGRYPNYNSVIPKNNNNIMTVNRLGMMAALKRISPFSNGSSNLIRMHVEENKLQLDAEDFDFSKTATESMTCDYAGTAMNIGFKGISVIELLDNLDSDEVVAEMADPSRAALFLPSVQPEDEEILMLQMPMLIND